MLNSLMQTCPAWLTAYERKAAPQMHWRGLMATRRRLTAFLPALGICLHLPMTRKARRRTFFLMPIPNTASRLAESRRKTLQATCRRVWARLTALCRATRRLTRPYPNGQRRRPSRTTLHPKSEHYRLIRTSRPLWRKCLMLAIML